MKHGLTKTFFAILLFLLSNGLVQGAERSLKFPNKKVKTKSPVEYRLPVNALNTPGDDQFIFIISQPGSYCFTNTIVGVNEKFGILIATNNITLDLNGFSLLGVPGSVNGITIGSGQTNIVVRNGFVSNWGTLRGVLQPAGITSFSSNVILERLILSDNQLYGFYGAGAVIRDCTVTGSSYGVFGGGVVSGCQVKQNGVGIFVHSNASVTTNNCSNNSTYGIFIDGANSRIEGNFVTGINDTGFGIVGRDAAYVTNNVVVKNIVTSGGSRNYSLNEDLNDVGPIGPAATNISPWGNISD